MEGANGIRRLGREEGKKKGYRWSSSRSEKKRRKERERGGDRSIALSPPPSPTSERAFNQLLSEYEYQFPFFFGLLLRCEFLALPGRREREEGKSNGA